MNTPPFASLGNFSISLAVKDVVASRDFYQKLGFVVRFGDADQGWLILQNAEATIGLFQWMIPRNTLTFNPGWDRDGAPTATFTDVRELQRRLREVGLEPEVAVDPTTEGPGFLTITDPDGNPILLDQHR